LHETKALLKWLSGAENKNADQLGSAFSLFILGGPGRNRTTDTRILKP